MLKYEIGTYQKHSDQMKRVDVLDGHMAYLDFGKGEPLLLLHGVPNSSWLYRKMINPLIENGFRVIVPDMFGYGSSDKPSDENSYHTKKQADRLLELMAHLKLKNWIHVCHDAGGPWTWELMLKEPARIKELIILNTIAYNEGFNPPFRKPHGTIMVNIMTRFYCTPIISNFIAGGFIDQSTDKVKLTTQDKQGYIIPLVRKGHHALRYFFGDFLYIEQLLDRVHEVFKLWDKPTLIIWGEEDKILDGRTQIPQLLQDMNKIKPEVHLLKNVGHLLQEDAPDHLVSLISKFSNFSGNR